jgi:hypothetical protein
VDLPGLSPADYGAVPASGAYDPSFTVTAVGYAHRGALVELTVTRDRQTSAADGGAS